MMLIEKIGFYYSFIREKQIEKKQKKKKNDRKKYGISNVTSAHFNSKSFVTDIYGKM